MRYLWFVLAATLIAVTAMAAQSQPAVSGDAVTGVEMAGEVVRVQVARGQAMPYLEVACDGKTTKVFLGSMRYLMQQDFNPKAGEPVKVTGFRRADEEVVAVAVTLTDQNKTLRLRDESGRPLWSQGRYGRGGRWQSQPAPHNQ